MLVGIVGFAGSGKDTIGQYLIDQHKFQKDSYAKPLKDAVATIFNWPREMLEGDSISSRSWREQVDPFWSEVLGREVTPRWILQNIGTELFRKYLHPDLWVMSMKHRLQQKINENIVITDCRFPNEIQLLRDFGGSIIRVIRGSEPEWFSIAKEANCGNEEAKKEMTKYNIHYSEWAWAGLRFDNEIYNNCDKEMLFAKVDSLMFNNADY